MQGRHPRPAFERKKGQSWWAPYYLDKEKNVKVPGGINTFLRDYQRQGVKFLWDKYDAGRGCVIGDDMGLVCCMLIVASKV